ncbi:NAD-dependent epimerase/dehydratase family protein [Prosthecomicrobium sp. N25]|uniref:NAD-dependent epimerase/dehydratase family protein n=1 Tax=Prosthecomicrobium sp. N25 TaxID=3129254 RepID=UPI00307830A8
MADVVIGGSGFLGRVLVRKLLERGRAVCVFDGRDPAGDQRDRVDFVRGDVRDPADLGRLPLGPDDVVYHLAARQFGPDVPRRERDAWFADVNVGGTRAVVARMQAAGARRLVFFSTDMTYGIPERSPVPPDAPQRPIGPYGRSKLEAEKILRSAPGLQVTVFRPRLIIGPGRLGILAKLFRLVRAGLPVPMIGSGRNCYQMVSVEDCAEAAILAVEQGCPPGPFNLGSESPPTSRALLEAVIRHAGTRSVLIPCPAALLKPVLWAADKAGMPLLFNEQYEIADAHYVLDTSATRSVLGWRPVHPDVEMFCRAYDAFLGRLPGPETAAPLGLQRERSSVP